MTETRSGAGHLSEDQLDAALMGCMADETAGHLEACECCQQRVVAARLPMESFKAMSLAWSERRSATMPVPQPAGLLESLGRRRRLGWGVAVAAMLTVLIVTPLEMRHGAHVATDDAAQIHATALGSTGVVSGQQSTEEQIERDNQLLNEIDRELNASSENPAALGLETVQGRTNHRAAGRAVQD